jgi:hypothetical protein
MAWKPDRTVRDGETVFPYRNTEEEYPSSIRAWLDERLEVELRETLESVRDAGTPRSRAILELAKFDAEVCGIHWHSIPWRDDMLGSGCQAWYVMGAVSRIDYLVHIGAVELKP